VSNKITSGIQVQQWHWCRHWRMEKHINACGSRTRPGKMRMSVQKQ